MWRAAAGQSLSACRAALAPMPRRRLVPGRDDTRDRLLARTYDGLASYAQYLDARQSLERSSDALETTELSDEISQRMKSYARDALEKWDGLVDVPGVWDVFIVKQVGIVVFSPPGNDSFRKDSCFTADVYLFIQCEISEMHRPIGAKFCTMISTRPNFIMPVQNFGGPKTCKIWPDFGRLQSLTVNISGMDEDIQNRTKTFCTAIPPVLGEKKFGELWFTNHGD